MYNTKLFDRIKNLVSEIRSNPSPESIRRQDALSKMRCSFPLFYGGSTYCGTARPDSDLDVMCLEDSPHVTSILKRVVGPSVEVEFHPCPKMSWQNLVSGVVDSLNKGYLKPELDDFMCSFTLSSQVPSRGMDWYKVNAIINPAKGLLPETGALCNFDFSVFVSLNKIASLNPQLSETTEIDSIREEARKYLGF